MTDYDPDNPYHHMILERDNTKYAQRGKHLIKLRGQVQSDATTKRSETWYGQRRKKKFQELKRKR